VVGTATLFFIDFGPNNEVKRNGISMITTAVVDRAGATALPTDFIPILSSQSAGVAGGKVGLGAAYQPSFLQGHFANVQLQLCPAG
jgi:hypothetical protein